MCCIALLLGFSWATLSINTLVYKFSLWSSPSQVSKCFSSPEMKDTSTNVNLNLSILLNTQRVNFK